MIARTLCIMRQSNFRPVIFLIMMLIFFFRFLRTKLPLDFFYFRFFLTSTSPAFWILNYEKQHKEGLCEVL